MRRFQIYLAKYAARLHLGITLVRSHAKDVRDSSVVRSGKEIVVNMFVPGMADALLQQLRGICANFAGIRNAEESG